MDTSTMLLVIAAVVIAMLGIFIWRLLKKQHNVQVITKNQYERLVADNIVSCKLNRMPLTKWIGITGDSHTPPIKKYIRYKGSSPHSRMVDLLVKRGANPARWFIVPWCLIENWGGRTIWINCTGFKKTDYFFRPIVPSDVIINGHPWTYYDNLINEHIKILLEIQGDQDMMEQVQYETISSAAHKDRSMSDIQSKGNSPNVTETEEYQPELEG
jgi:hypothetical protein